MPRPATAYTRRPLPAGVYFSARNGGLYIYWNGTPGGYVTYTRDRKLAMRGFDGLEWLPTDYRGVDANCEIGRIIGLVAEYDDAWGRI
jgi:hypothetical protein